MTDKYRFKCKNCSRQCALKVKVEEGEIVKVRGNLCKKGEKYAQKKLKKKGKIKK